jgi:cullin-4
MAVEQQLLARHVSTLLDKGFQQLMAGHRLADLGRLHSLLGRVNALDQLKAAWRDYISDKVVKIVKDELNVRGVG